MSDEPYDPLDYANLAKSVVQALLGRAVSALPPGDDFRGPGVYALYYSGDFGPYAPIAKRRPVTPIYVGCAMPTGGRKGADVTAATTGRELHSRLGQHATNIEQAENLDLSHFRCRYLVVLPVWIRLAERFLISHHRPVWNLVIDGFGNHDPGAGRRSGRRPRWDIVHPGRPWAEELTPAEGADSTLTGLGDFWAQE